MRTRYKRASSQQQDVQVLTIVGPSDAGKTTLVERLTARLSERGRVGTIKHINCEPDLDTAGKDTARHRAAGASRTYGIAEGEWFLTGDSTSLETALDDLAASCAYALVEGYTDAALPTVALGGRSVDNGTILARAPSADDIDVDEVTAALDSTSPYETLSSMVADTKRSRETARTAAVAACRVHVAAADDGDADPPVAALREDLASREGVHEVQFHRQTGVEPAGPDSLFVVVLGADRAGAFAAVEAARTRLETVDSAGESVLVEDC